MALSTYILLHVLLVFSSLICARCALPVSVRVTRLNEAQAAQATQLLDMRHITTVRAPARPPIGSHYAQLLHGACWATRARGYRWIACPFDNVTQRSLETDFVAVLGVYEKGDGPAQDLTDGSNSGCGGSRRRTRLELVCDSFSSLDVLEDPALCSYALELHLPQLCRPVLHLTAPHRAADGFVASGGDSSSEGAAS